MRFDILTITQGRYKYYQLRVYLLAYQPAKEIHFRRFDTKTELYKYIRKCYS